MFRGKKISRFAQGCEVVQVRVLPNQREITLGRVSHSLREDTYFIDEVFVKINGKPHCPWRVVDQDGELVDVYLQAKRDGGPPERCFSDSDCRDRKSYIPAASLPPPRLRLAQFILRKGQCAMT